MKWVTERRPHVDRCASAWFIRRFVDPKARFQFVGPGEDVPSGATPFDLPTAELGHHQGKVTFDALLAKYRTCYPRQDAGLARIADLVRDIDLAAFRRPESRGIETLLFGLLLCEPNDGRVLRKTELVFDSLYQYFLASRGS